MECHTNPKGFRAEKMPMVIKECQLMQLEIRCSLYQNKAREISYNTPKITKSPKKIKILSF